MTLSFWFGEVGRETLLLLLLIGATAAQTVLENPILDGALLLAWLGLFLHAFVRVVRGGRRMRLALLVGVVVLVGLRVASAQGDEVTPPAGNVDLSTQISIALISLGVFIGAVNQTVDLIIKPFVNSTMPATPEMDYWRGWLLRGVAALIGVFAAFSMQFNAFGFVQQVFPQISTNLLIVVTGSTAALGSQGIHRVAALIKQIMGIWTGAPKPDTAALLP